MAVATVVSAASDYANEIERLLDDANIPVLVDTSNNTVSRKIRRFHNSYIPCQLVVGQKELAERTVSLRLSGCKDGEKIPMEDIVSVIKRKTTMPA